MWNACIHNILVRKKSCSNFNFLLEISRPENLKEAFFLITSFLFAEIKDDVREKTCGYCHIGDTNWTYNQLIIGYNPRKDGLSLFAQDPETLGLFELDHMEVFPMQWKLYEDLTRPEIMIPGIKIWSNFFKAVALTYYEKKAALIPKFISNAQS